MITVVPREFPDDMMRLGFHDMAEFLWAWCEAHYPADVFTGESGDAGPAFIVKLREAHRFARDARHGPEFYVQSMVNAPEQAS